MAKSPELKTALQKAKGESTEITVANETTDHRKQMAMEAHIQVVSGAIISALALKRIKDDQLYLEMGFDHFNQYVETKLPFGRQQAYAYLAVADSFSVSDQSDTAIPENITSLGMAKLHQLSKTVDHAGQALLENGEIELPDGTILTVPEIESITVKQLKKELAEAKKKAAKSTLLEEQLADANQRAELAQELLDKSKEDFDRASRDLANEKAFKAHLSEAQGCFTSLVQALNKIDLTNPADITDDQKELLGAFWQTIRTYYTKNDELISLITEG